MSLPSGMVVLIGAEKGRGRDDEGRRLRPPARTVPDGAAGVLLPDARLVSRRRGPGPGHVPEGGAGRAREEYDETRSSLRTWLYRIASNACLTALEVRGRRPLPSGLVAASDP